MQPFRVEIYHSDKSSLDNLLYVIQKFHLQYLLSPYTSTFVKFPSLSDNNLLVKFTQNID